MPLPDGARAMIESGRLAHLVTLNRDGSPQVSCVWVGLDGDEIVSGHLSATSRRSATCAAIPALALDRGNGDPAARAAAVPRRPRRARVTEGGAPELLQGSAYRYLGPDVKFPPMSDPPPGIVVRVTVERLGGVGPWSTPSA